MKTFALPARLLDSGLAGFGYTERESAFLRLAALHGGYFLRRQVAHFLGTKDGSVVTQLVQKTLDLEHATCSTWRQAVHVYHLGSRPFYEALGEPDNRNRRRHELAQIKSRIMTLDFVLAHPAACFLASETVRLAFFDGLGIDRNQLPCKRFHAGTSSAFTTRYFVDRDPIFTAGPRQDGAPVSPRFAFVDAGLVTLSRFERFLNEHALLFDALISFAVVYVAATPRHFESAQALFERRIVKHQGAAPHVSELKSEDLVTYFELRKRFEDREFAAFNRDALLRLRNAQHTYASPAIEAMYRNWHATEHMNTTLELNANPSPLAHVSKAFSTSLLTHDYALFGHFLPR